jgi:hypothetical protein
MLWVDAVCINQDDIDESNKQVAMMYFIYSRAQKVIAWLGAKPYPSQQNPFHCMSMDWKAGEAARLAASLAVDAKVKYTSAPDKNIISRLADSTYWTRLWIVQEACLAYDLIFVYGSSVWTFERLCVLNPLEGIPPHDADERMRYDPMLRLVRARVDRHTDATRLESLIERFRKQSCSDLRDRVYGLVALANDVRPFSGADEQTPFIKTKTLGANSRHLGYEPSESLGDPHRARRKKGRIKIDRLRSFYDIWKDVVTHAFFCARPADLSWSMLVLDQSRKDIFLRLKDMERNMSIVRTSGIVQEALGHHVERLQVSKDVQVPTSPSS